MQGGGNCPPRLHCPPPQVTSPDQNVPQVEQHVTSRGQLWSEAEQSAQGRRKTGPGPSLPGHFPSRVHTPKRGHCWCVETRACHGARWEGDSVCAPAQGRADFCPRRTSAWSPTAGPRAGTACACSSRLSPGHTDGQREAAPPQPQGGGWGAGLPGLLIPPGVKGMPPGRPVLEHSAALSGAARRSFCSLSPHATGHSLLLSPGWPPWDSHSRQGVDRGVRAEGHLRAEKPCLGPLKEETAQGPELQPRWGRTWWAPVSTSVSRCRASPGPAWRPRARMQRKGRGCARAQNQAEENRNERPCPLPS